MPSTTLPYKVQRWTRQTDSCETEMDNPANLDFTLTGQKTSTYSAKLIANLVLNVE